jgi:hypothetical protein
MRRLAVFVAVLSLLAYAGAAAHAAGVPPFPHLLGNWSHAEINVTIHRQPHTLILDRGRITQVSATQLTLREHDGSTVVVPVSFQTIVVVNRFRATIYDLRRRMIAETMRIDGGPAVRVRAVTL